MSFGYTCERTFDTNTPPTGVTSTVPACKHTKHKQPNSHMAHDKLILI